MHILEKIKLAEAEFKKVADEYSIYISDKSIPLMERWDTYINAPDSMKWASDSIVEFDHEILKQLCNQGQERYRTVDVTDRVTDIVYCGKFRQDNVFSEGKFSDQDVMNAMEEVLACNISTFINDW